MPAEPATETVRFKLTGGLRGRRFRLLLPPDGGVLGSGVESALRVRDPTVSESHARLEPRGLEIRVVDLGSTNGTFVRGRRVENASVGLGEVVVFGQVELKVEKIAAADIEPAFTLPDAAGDSATGVASQASKGTLGLQPLNAFVLETMPALTRLLLRGSSPAEMAQAVGGLSCRVLPLAGLEVRDAGSQGVLFSWRPEDLTRLPSAEVRSLGRDAEGWVVQGWVRRTSSVAVIEPILQTLVDLVALAELRGPRPAGVTPVDTAPPAMPSPPSLDSTMLDIYQRAARVARGDVSVIILGESGTGKEVLARFLHEASERTGPMVSMNCAALPDDLAEAELFGVEKGTATGVDARPGKFEQADGGTLLLDEIGDMALTVQAKVLRVIQEGKVHRLGGLKERPARARLLASTNQDLERLLTEGRFRRDLYHRLAGWVVNIPPLRERRCDIPNLTAHFLRAEVQRRGGRFRGVSRAALEALMAYDWPGNVRQLQLELQRAALFLEDDELLESTALELGELDTRPVGLQQTLARAERQAIEATLASCAGQVPMAAKRLGISRSTLYRRIRDLELTSPARQTGAQDPGPKKP